MHMSLKGWTAIRIVQWKKPLGNTLFMGPLCGGRLSSALHAIPATCGVHVSESN